MKAVLNKHKRAGRGSRAGGDGRLTKGDELTGVKGESDELAEMMSWQGQEAKGWAGRGKGAK